MSEPVRNPDELTGEALATDIAQRVMGYWITYDLDHYGWWTDGRRFICHQDEYRPDRDIATAWEVRSAMIARGWAVEITTDNSCIMEWGIPEDADYIPIAKRSDNAATAICRAALAAVEART